MAGRAADGVRELFVVLVTFIRKGARSLPPRPPAVRPALHCRRRTTTKKVEEGKREGRKEGKRPSGYAVMEKLVATECQAKMIPLARARTPTAAAAHEGPSEVEMPGI